MEGDVKMRSKYLSIVAAGFLAFASAHADPILVDPTMSGSNVDAQITSSNCLGCFVDTSLSGGLESAMQWLDTGDSFTFDFFNLVVGGLIGSAEIQVNATLALASPVVSATGNGFGGFASFLYIFNAVELSWVQPAAIDLGDGTYLGVSFENLFEFGIGNTTTVSATIARYGSDAASVPEPETAALLIVGLLALWLAAGRPMPVGGSRIRVSAAA